MLKNQYVFYFVLLLFCTPILSQNTIEGSIKISSNEPLSFASVVLKTSTEKVFVAGTVSDEKGFFVLSKINPGTYILEIGMLGYEPKIIENIVVKDQNIVLESNILKEAAQTIDEIHVSARKTMYERKVDRLVVNVQSSALAAGSSALDIIERSPGMTVNRQGGVISMAGRDGVVVMINGKRQFIQDDALIGLLSGINANNIAKLEIISTPPASFDAEGNAGFINIVLIKSDNEGYNGNFGLALGGYKGFIGNTNAAVTINTKKWSSYIDASLSANQQSQDFRFERTTFSGQNATNIATINDRNPKRLVGTVRIGTSYNFGQSSVSLGANGYFNNWSMDATSTADITKNQHYDNTILSTQTEKNEWQHGGLSLGFSHKFANRSLLNISSDLLSYTTENPTMYTNKFVKPTTETGIAANSKSFKSTPIQVLVNAIDYEYKRGKFNLESGAKLTLSSFDNDASVDYQINNIWVRQPQYSSYAAMNENIVAAYTSVGGSLSEKTSFKVGLRFEKSVTKIRNENDSTLLDRDLPYFFPSIFISHEITEKSSINISASRRITRPTFNDLAPFIFFTDPTSLVTGNPALLPVLSQSVRAEYKYNNKVFSLQYAIDQNPIARFVPALEGSSTNIIARVRNFDRFTTLSATIAYPIVVKKWWDININLTSFRQKIYGTYETSNIEIQRLSANAFVNNAFSLPKSFTAEIGGFFNTGGFFGPFQNKPFGSIKSRHTQKSKKIVDYYWRRQCLEYDAFYI
ncbi:MAG: outer membrane beta-barrel protein [Saprospiraceae bacterium]|nr:outer membrane beta-barrel protein [Saprospiraceae bacterium]